MDPGQARARPDPSGFFKLFGGLKFVIRALARPELELKASGPSAGQLRLLSYCENNYEHKIEQKKWVALDEMGLR